MKTCLALSVFAIALSSQASQVPNELARLQLQRVLFGNETTKTERMNLLGRQQNGESCVIELRKTRFGVYVGVTALPASERFEAGVTNSNYTTQNLDFNLDDQSAKFSRLGVTGINERGEDYGNETASIVFAKINGVTQVKAVEVTYQSLDFDVDANRDPVYTPKGDVRKIDCVAF